MLIKNQEKELKNKRQQIFAKEITLETRVNINLQPEITNEECSGINDQVERDTSQYRQKNGLHRTSELLEGEKKRKVNILIFTLTADE